MTVARARKIGRFHAIAALTLLINALLFTGLPNLMKDDFPTTDLEILQQVDFLREAPEEKTAERKEKLSEPQPEKPLDQLPQRRPEPVRPQKPESLKMEMPDFDFEVRPELKMGAPVGPPPVEGFAEKPIEPVAAPSPSPAPAPVAVFKGSYESMELDRVPVATAKMRPDYPYRARRLGLEGEVDVRFMVDKDGRVGKISILDARPPKVFDASVLEALPRWRFEPGRVRGKPVNSWVTTTIEFKIDSL